MEVPKDFQYVLNGSTEIIISIILISVVTYYFISKGKTTLQRHECTSSLTSLSHLNQQPSLETGHQNGHFNPNCNSTKQRPTKNQSALSSAILSNAFSDNPVIDEEKHGMAGSQGDKESTTGNEIIRITDEKPSYVMQDKERSNIPGLASLVTRENNWSEMEKFGKATGNLDVTVAAATSSITTTVETDRAVTSKAMVQHLVPKNSLEFTQDATLSTTISARIVMENQQVSVAGTHRNATDKSEAHDNSKRVDQLPVNYHRKNSMIQLKADSPMESSDQQTDKNDRMETTECMNYAELSRSIGLDDNAQTKAILTEPTVVTSDNDKNNPSAVSLGSKKTCSNDISPPTHEPQAANITISAKNPMLSSKRSKGRVQRNSSATAHAKPLSVPLHQSHIGTEPKRGMTIQERIDQQRQPYIALYKSRCEFWPRCTNNHCKYYHPFTECRNGIACKFGNKCVFLHPKDYLDHQYVKQTGQAKKKSTKSRTKIKMPVDKQLGNSTRSNKETLE